MKIIGYLNLLVVPLFFFSSCKTEEEIVECLTQEICIAESELEVTTEYMLTIIPGTFYHRAWMITNDQEGQIADCVEIENNAIRKMKKPCGNFHLTIVVESCLSPGENCNFHQIKTYTDLNTDHFYLKSRKDNRSESQNEIGKEVFVLINHENQQISIPYVVTADNGVNQGSTHLGSKTQTTTNLLLKSHDKNVYYSIIKDDKVYYNFIDFSTTNSITLNIDDFLSKTKSNDFPGGTHLSIAGLILNDGILSNWGIFPANIKEAGLDILPDLEGKFDKILTSASFQDETGWYHISKISDEIINSYTPEKIDFDLIFTDIHDFEFVRGEKEVTHYSLKLEAWNCNRWVSDWTIYGDFEKSPTLFCKWPSCINTELPTLDSYNLAKFQSYFHSEITDYPSYLNNNFYTKDARNAEWFYLSGYEELVGNDFRLEDKYQEIKTRTL